MTQKSKTVVFFGNERLATGATTTAPTLRALIAAGYHVAAVITQYEKGRSRNVRPLEIAVVAAEHNIPVLLPEKLRDIQDQIKAFQAEAAVLVAYGKIIPQDIIDIFPIGIINIHPSLLPLHRGPTPIESVILGGDGETGVSIMQLARAMDAGPVYAQERIKLDGTETKISLSETLLRLGGDMLMTHLPAILDGSLKPTPQDENIATFDSMVQKDDGIIDWSKQAIQIEREVRAYQEWPKSRTKLGDVDVVISSSVVSRVQIGKPGEIIVSGKELFVACGKDSLKIVSLKPAGKKEMPAQAFLAGYVDRIGAS